MEEMDCRDLHAWAKKLDGSTGSSRAYQVIDFAAACMTVVKTELAQVTARLRDGRLPDMSRIKKHRAVTQTLLDVSATADAPTILTAMGAIEQIPEKILYRRELWREMERSLRLQARTPGIALADAAWKVRNRTRQAGRAVEYRTVSRTLLVKGLEFDHAVVLDAAEHDLRNFYVAVTRASKSLTVLSENPKIRPPFSLQAGGISSHEC
jgi:DNA helicase-2/ATP-dependent DNA helicase PcrA